MVVYKVCLDPGHGKGYNHSNVTPAYYEGTRMWEYSRLLMTELQRCGFDVMTTRPNLTDDPSLSERGRMAGNWGADLLLSLHSNAPGSTIDPVTGAKYYDPSVRGLVTVPTIRNLSQSRPLANKLAEKLGEVMGNGVRAVFTKESETSPGWDWYGILKWSMYYGCKNAVIVEHGFHTNKEDSEWLLDDDNLQKLAIAEAKVVCDYFGVEYVKAKVQPSTDADTYPPTEPDTLPDTYPPTEPDTLPPTDPPTDPDTAPHTPPDTVPDTVPDTYPPTDPPTDPDTLPPTGPDGCDPNVYPPTGPDTLPPTEPDTLPPTEPDTMPDTYPTNEFYKVTVCFLEKGYKGSQVKAVQSILNGLGYTDSDKNKLDVDGKFGPKTEFAVKVFQKQNRIQINGKVDKDTWLRLLGAY